MEDLRECPCCGKAAQGKGTYIRSGSGGNSGFMRGWVGCPECGLYIQWTHDPEGAVAKWNRRASNGRWKPVGSITPMYECDQCHTITLGGKFCPNCGAKMEGVPDT